VAQAEAAPPTLLPTPAHSRARRSLRARAGRIWRAAQRKLSFG
jgi:hypothetical protein